MMEPCAQDSIDEDPCVNAFLYMESGETAPTWSLVKTNLQKAYWVIVHLYTIYKASLLLLIQELVSIHFLTNFCQDQKSILCLFFGSNLTSYFH